MTSTRPESEVIAELAEQAKGAEVLYDSAHAEPIVAAVPDGYGRVRIEDLEKYAEHPRHATAERQVYDAGSFARYLDVHAGRDTEAFADVQTARVVAVIDSHSPAAHREAGWQKHRITLQLTQSPSWKAWTEKDGVLMSQVDFAELIELQAPDVFDPEPADLLDLAQHFEATRSVDFQESERLADGQTRLRYVETVTARAGQKGDLEIPAEIKLRLRPYIGGPAYGVRARFRYRIGTDRRLRLGYVLDRPQAALDGAFEDVVQALRDGSPGGPAGENGEPAVPGIPPVQAPIYLGRP